MFSTAAAPLSVRRRQAAARLVPATLAAPRRAALVTSRALRGVFWHVSACHRRQDAWLPRLRPRASGRLFEQIEGTALSEPVTERMQAAMATVQKSGYTPKRPGLPEEVSTARIEALEGSRSL